MEFSVVFLPFKHRTPDMGDKTLGVTLGSP